MISIILVEDQIAHQEYIKNILDGELGFNCLAVINNGETAIKEIIRLKPDIVLMDIGLPDKNGIECIRELKFKCPEVKFMVCTVLEEDEKILQAIIAGAHSYIVKKSKPYQIIDAIKELHEGNSPISSCIANKLLDIIAEKKDPEQARIAYNITQRENEILNLLAKGHFYQEISNELSISVKTIKWHIYNIYIKLQVDNRTEAINKYFG